MRVLVTGAAGRIGTVVVPGLVELGHEVVGLDRADPTATVQAAWFTGDCSERAVEAADGCDAIVHLAGNPGNTETLAESLDSHAGTTQALLEAMRQHGIRRIAYASSNHAVGFTPRQNLVDADVRPRPDTYYGVGKVAAEALLSLYGDRYGIESVAMRIGSFQERPRSTRQLSTWLSHGDCVRMVQAALTAPHVGYAVLYGISANTDRWWDLEPGRALGYRPVDDAATYAADVSRSEDDAAEGAYVGGGFAWKAEA